MLLPLVLLFIGVSIAEIYVLIQVGQAIGALPTIGLLILDSILGSALLRSQGRAVWRRFNAALAERRPPTREVADGALVITGGALLISPGFITDIAGVLLLVPPTRGVVRRALARRFSSHVAVRAGRAGTGYARTRPRGAPADPQREYDVEGTAVDVDPRDTPRLP
jgi:UPF0716 protein FxsA